MAFPLIEYPCDPEIERQEDGSPFRWLGTVTIDLRWVATARPWYPGVTVIVMAGSSGPPMKIKADYADFVRDWSRAREA